MIPQFQFPYGLDVPLPEARAWGLLDSSGLKVTNPALQSAVRASRQLSGNGSGTGSGAAGSAITGFADGETVTIELRNGDTIVYTFMDTPANANDLYRSGTLDTDGDRLAKAINGTGVVGTDYFEGTEHCYGSWEAAWDSTNDRLDVDAINYGDVYGTTSFAETCANAAWNTATAGVDTPDFKIAKEYGTPANASAAPIARNGIFPIAPSGDQLTGIHHVEFDDDSGGGLFVRDDFLLVPTDHPKAAVPNGCLYAGVVSDPANDIAAGTVDVPINTSHADSGDWTGDDGTMPPETDDSINGDLLELFVPYNGYSVLLPIKDFDADGGAGANEARITFGVDDQIATDALSILQDATHVYYRVYEDLVALTGDMMTQAKADVNGEADTALTDYDAPTRAEATSDVNSVLARLPTSLVGGRMDADVGAVTMTDIGGIDVSELNQIVDDLLDAGRLDVLIDAIKAKTDLLTFTGSFVQSDMQAADGAAIAQGGSSPASPIGLT